MVKRYMKNPVGAHYGLGDWLLQRLTAVVMLGYTVFATGFLAYRHPRGYQGWSDVFNHTWFQVGTMLFVAALAYHAWVGVRDIIMDYVRATGMRLFLECVVAFVLFFYVVWAASILWNR